jgi:hypothetical protein
MANAASHYTVMQAATDLFYGSNASRGIQLVDLGLEF